MTNSAPPSTALVTGASTGIGLELARCFAAHGHSLVLTARNEERLKTAASELARLYGIPVHVIPADLSTPDGPQQIVRELQLRNLHIDILVNNAGFGTHGKFWESTLEQELALIQVNIAAVLTLTRLLLPAMVQRNRGRVLNVASVAAFQPGPLMANYYASKAYVLSFSEALSSELRRTGVTVTALCPGPTDTEFAARAGMQNSKLYKLAGLSPAQVAAAGYRGLMRNKRVVLPGWSNLFLANTARFVPKRLLLRVTRKLNESR